MQLKQDIDDRRNGSRLTYRVHVTVTLLSDGITFQGWSNNVSISGLALDAEIPEKYQDQECIVHIVFPGESSKLIIDDVHGQVVRCSTSSSGISFLNPLEWFVLFPVYQGKMARMAEAETE